MSDLKAHLVKELRDLGDKMADLKVSIQDQQLADLNPHHHNMMKVQYKAMSTYAEALEARIALVN